MDEIIQIGLTASVEINYIKLLINSLILLADNPKNLEFIIGVDKGPGKGNIDLSSLKKHKIIYHNTKLPYSSMAHGVLMDKLLMEYFDKKYGMLIDADVCMLKKGWDTSFKNELNKNNLIYLGTESDDKNRKFPGPYCMFFLTKEMQEMKYSTQPLQSLYLERKYDFGESFKKSLIQNPILKLSGNFFILEKNAKIYDLSDGSKTFLDTNSQFNIFFHDKKDKYKLLKCYWKEDANTKFLNKEKGQGNEFQINGEVYCTHQGRTRRGWGIDLKNIKWINQIKNWFNDEEIAYLFNNIN